MSRKLCLSAAKLLSDPRRLSLIQSDECDHVLLQVSVHIDLADDRLFLEEGLEPRRRDILSTRCLEEVLLSIRDPQPAASVDLTNVAGAKVALLVKDLSVALGQVEIARENSRSTKQNLAVLSKLVFHARQDATYGSQPHVIHCVREADSAGF